MEFTHWLKRLVQTFKRGSLEQKLAAALGLLLPLIGVTGGLPKWAQEAIHLDQLHSAAPWLAPAAWVAFACVVIFFIRTRWRRLEPSGPGPNNDEEEDELPTVDEHERVPRRTADETLPEIPAVGAHALGPNQGELFQRLERSLELGRLESYVANSDVALVTIRGQAGAGKTSLLRSGLSWRLKLRNVPLVPVEMFPTDPIASVVRVLRDDGRFPLPPKPVPPNQESPGKWTDAQREVYEKELQEDLPRCLAAIFDYDGPRFVLALDQFETLNESRPAHAPIFDLIRQCVRRNPPHPLLFIVAYREEYEIRWADFDDTLEPPSTANCESLPVQFFTKQQAQEILAVLAAQSDVQPEEALARKYLDQVARYDGTDLWGAWDERSDRCIAPVDLAICLQALLERKSRTKQSLIRESDFLLDGGAVGMLASFLRSQVLRCIAAENEPIVYEALLRLCIPGTPRRPSQRVSEGLSLEGLSKGLPRITPTRWKKIVNRLEGPTARLLEVVATPEGNRYRLANDRLVEAVRQLGGARLADEQKAETLFENTYWGFRNIGTHVHLRGGDLKLVEEHIKSASLLLGGIL